MPGLRISHSYSIPRWPKCALIIVNPGGWCAARLLGCCRVDLGKDRLWGEDRAAQALLEIARQVEIPCVASYENVVAIRVVRMDLKQVVEARLVLLLGSQA